MDISGSPDKRFIVVVSLGELRNGFGAGFSTQHLLVITIDKRSYLILKELELYAVVTRNV